MAVGSKLCLITLQFSIQNVKWNMVLYGHTSNLICHNYTRLIGDACYTGSFIMVTLVSLYIRSTVFSEGFNTLL